MHTAAQYKSLLRPLVATRLRTATVMAVLLCGPGVAREKLEPPDHMPEKLRSTVTSVVVVAGPHRTEEEITGSYEKITPGVYGGISQGAALGSRSGQIGPLNVSFPFPILTVPGPIAGGIAGASRREIQ